MERIKPLPDHLALQQLKEGEAVTFAGAEYTVVNHTTLASGEPALILARANQQFVIGAAQFFAGTKPKIETSKR
jgi:hypothetical protein